MRQPLIALTLAALSASPFTACNPYRCTADYRSTSYGGVLGRSVAPAVLGERDSGRVFIQLNEWRGSLAQQNVVGAVTVWGYLDTVTVVHVHAGTPAAPGRVLWGSAAGYLVRDSIWNVPLDLFHGPASWTDFWNALDSGRAYFEIHAPGDSVRAGLRQIQSSPFSPSCT